MISRLAFVGCLLLLFGGLALKLIPEFKSLQATDDKLARMKLEEQQLKEDKERLASECVALDGDPKFVELRARQLFEWHKAGETIFRFTE